jgi:hypothetical protein
MIHLDRTAKRIRPEARRSVDILRVAVNQNAVDSGAMHFSLVNLAARPKRVIGRLAPLFG